MKEAWKIENMVILSLPRIPVKNKKLRRVAWGEGVLSDAVRWKRIVEEGGIHTGMVAKKEHVSSY